MSLFLGGLRALFRRLGCKFGFGLLSLRGRFGFRRLTYCDFVRFVLCLFDGLELQRFDCAGDIANLVLAAKTRQHHVEIALRHELDRTGDAHDRPCNPAADEQRGSAADDDGNHQNDDKQRHLPFAFSVAERDLEIAKFPAGIGQIVGKFFDRRIAARGAHHQRQGGAGIAVSHVDDAFRLFDVTRDHRLQLCKLLGGLAIVECRIAQAPSIYSPSRPATAWLFRRAS